MSTARGSRPSATAEPQSHEAADPQSFEATDIRPFEQITMAVTSWPGVHAGAGRRGEFAFKVGRREIGHLHGDRAAHFGFPKDVWRELNAAGRIEHHPVFPGREGPAARRISSADDVADVIALLRLNYERVVQTHGLPAQ